jgi:carbon storage regulator CsrA
MLVLGRKSQESVVVGTADNLQEMLRVTVVGISGGRVKLGFKAGDDVAIYREEVWERVRAECEIASPK